MTAETITLVVQVNGKLRDRIQVAAGLSDDGARTAALASTRVAPHLEGKSLRRAIHVPDKLINLVVG